MLSIHTEEIIIQISPSKTKKKRFKKSIWPMLRNNRSENIRYWKRSDRPIDTIAMIWFNKWLAQFSFQQMANNKKNQWLEITVRVSVLIRIEFTINESISCLHISFEWIKNTQKTASNFSICLLRQTEKTKFFCFLFVVGRNTLARWHAHVR